MDGNDRELGDLVQAQKTEIEDLKSKISDLQIDSDKNRTVTRERPVMTKKPIKHEGRDSDHRFFEENGSKYYSIKVGGRWVKVEVTDV